MRLRLPREVVERAAAYASGERVAVAPKDAATVVLLREGSVAPELYLLHRQPTMSFAAGMAVFPGGGVDDSDFGVSEWFGPTPEQWALRLDAAPGLAAALVVAAVRETFEESGVLLAGTGPESVVGDVSGADWEVDRLALVAKEQTFGEFLTRRGLRIRTDLLGVWSGWQTPAFESRRFRTVFFVAALPAGQVTRDVSTEAASVRWLPAEQACTLAESREVMMMPPTYATCVEVADYDSISAVLAAAQGRVVSMFTPAVVRLPDGSHTMSAPEALADLLAARS